MAKYSSDNPNRIVRIDGNGVFLEAVADSFNIDKVKLIFSQYNRATHETIQRIDCYLNFGTALHLFDQMMNGPIATEILQRQEAVQGDKDLKLPLHTVWTNPYMGTSAERANRSDRKAEHRCMTLTLGNKILIKAESGPGKELDKGQITKDYDKPEKSISVNVASEEFYAFIYTVKAHVQGFIASLYPYKSNRYMYNDIENTYEPYNAEIAKQRYEARQRPAVSSQAPAPSSSFTGGQGNPFQSPTPTPAASVAPQPTGRPGNPFEKRVG